MLIAKQIVIALHDTFIIKTIHTKFAFTGLQIIVTTPNAAAAAAAPMLMTLNAPEIGLTLLS